MPIQVWGIYRNGKVELSESVPDLVEGLIVSVTIPAREQDAGVGVELSSLGIGPEQTADLRAPLSAMEEDWNDPAMDVYNDDASYDAAHARLYGPKS